MIWSSPSATAALAIALALGSATSTLAASLPIDVPQQRFVLAPVGSAPHRCIRQSAPVWVTSSDGARPLELHKLRNSRLCQASVSLEFASVQGAVLIEIPGDDSGTVLVATPEAVERDAASATAGPSWQDRLRASVQRASQEVTGPGSAGLVVQRETFEDVQLLDVVGERLDDREAPVPAKIRLLHGEADYALLQVDAATLSRIDTLIPWDTRVRRIAFSDVAQSRAASDGDDDRQPPPEPHFTKPRYNSLIDTIISSSAFDVERLRKDVRILTGEDKQPGPGWSSRHSSTYGAIQAAKWIKDELSDSLSSIPGARCSLWQYDAYFSPNVVCTIPAGVSATASASDEIVLVSSHYDSRGTFGSTTAPGGDDDGSGTTALLAIARSLGHFAPRLSHPVRLVAFSGEEQGLIGSNHYSSSLRDSNTTVRLALQMDMLAYRAPGEPMQIAFPDKLATTTATDHVRRLAQIYAPELVVGFTPACCSDHQSFWERGFPATWVFERNGPIADPMYHNSGDRSDREGYDLVQLGAIARVVTASLLDVAGFYL